MYYEAQANGSHKYDKKTIDQDHHCNSDLLDDSNAGDLMSDYMEILNPQNMTGRLYFQGEILDEYKIEQCDKCSKLVKLDSFGYQKGYDHHEKVIWFCGDCR